MRQGKHYLKTAARLAEVSDTVLPGIPLIEICDRGRVLIENHYGVIGYSTEEIYVKVRYGIVVISGQGLCLNIMCKDRLVVSGTIHSVLLREKH